MTHDETHTNLAPWSGTPGLAIQLRVEAAPVVHFFCLNECEETRVLDWIRSRAELAEIVRLALQLAEEARAA